MYFRVDVERRVNGASAVGAHRTAMMQDLETGRMMETDPLLMVVQVIARVGEKSVISIGPSRNRGSAPNVPALDLLWCLSNSI